MIYEWGQRSFGVDANVVGTIVERIAKENDGVCPPALLVDEARTKDSALHGLFTWDNRKAADEWRKQEARQVVKALVVVVDDSEIRPPAFVHVRVSTDNGEREGYSATLDVIKDPALRSQALHEAIVTLRGFRRRYEALTELQPVWEALDAVVQ